MPTYEYRCQACGCSFEQFASFADFQSVQRCSCGGHASNVISGGKTVLVKGMGEYKFDKRTNAFTAKGRSAAKEEKHYEHVIETQRKIVKERRESGRERKDGWVFEGVMPAPMATSIGVKEGDIEAVMKDPVPFLKATGTYMGTD